MRRRGCPIADKTGQTFSPDGVSPPIHDMHARFSEGSAAGAIDHAGFSGSGPLEQRHRAGTRVFGLKVSVAQDASSEKSRDLAMRWRPVKVNLDQLDEADTVLDNVVLKDRLGKEATDPPLPREGGRT